MPEIIPEDYAYGKPLLTGSIRVQPEDFIVNEFFAFDFTNEGEHVLLHIEKKNTNTEWLARQLVKIAGVRSMDVSYAGLKDRNALTTQWFSIWMPKRDEPDWSQVEDENIRIIEKTRHNRKLRRGSLRGNHFNLRVTNISGDSSDLNSRLENMNLYGVPNYYGVQRFGHEGMNLEKAEAMFNGVKIKDRHKRSLYLSAARSFIFNHYLSNRVKEHTWYKALVGDVMLLDNSHSYFILDECNEEITQRMLNKDIHPSGPLWGKGELKTTDKIFEMEQSLSKEFELFTTGLEQKGLKQERRSLRLVVNNLQASLADETLNLSFSLPPGGYATSVLRELALINNDSP